MTKTTTVAIGAIGAALLVGGAVTGTQLSDSTSTTTAAVTTNTAIGAPPVKIVAVGSTDVLVDLGPRQPGPFTPSNARARSLKISWPPTVDTLHPTGIIYKVYKNGKLINSSLVNTYITVGFTTLVRSFKFCVVAVNINAMSSPKGCTVFSGH